MKVSEGEFQAEVRHLESVLSVIDRQGAFAGKVAQERLKEAAEFKKYLWERGREMDIAEKAENRRSTNFEMRRVESKHRFLAKLLKARKNPFFGSLEFKDEFGDTERLYIGLMQIEEEGRFYVYDWRAPISSMFYDFGLGPAWYEAPLGRIGGAILNADSSKLRMA